MIKKILMILVIMAVAGCSEPEEKNEIIISVAASLTEGIEELAKTYTRDTGTEVRINTGGSGSLKRQVENGAPVDFIFLASKRYVEELVKGDLLKKREDLLSNILVVAGKEEIDSLRDIKGLVAMGDPDFVPAGRYAREALTRSGVWDEIEKNLLLTKDVRSALSYINRGEVDYSVVYQTDAILLKDSVIYEIDREMYSPIIYSAGVKSGSKEGQKFNDYLLENIDVFEKYGFKVR